MPNRFALLLLASCLAAFAQSSPPPSTPLTYFLGRGVTGANPKAVVAGPGGDIWVGGETNGNNLPVENAFQQEFSPGFCGRFGCTDMFLSRLRADGQGAVFSTYLGGAGGETLSDIAVDGEGNSYLVGTTSSESFPFTTPLPGDTLSAYRPFVVKISPTGELVYAAALPLALFPEAVVVDRLGSAYVGGTSFGEVGQIGGLGLQPGEAELLRSDDGGQGWEFRNRGLTGATFSGVSTKIVTARRGDGVRLYVLGTVALYRSDDRGELWKRLTSPQDVEYAYFSDVAADSSDPDRVFVTYSCRLYGSSDGGETWNARLRYESPARCVSHLAVAPSRPEIIYAGGYGNEERPGVFAWMARSDDRGQNWTDVPLPQGENLSSVEDLAIDPADPRIVYAVCVADGGFTLFRTGDAGQNWHRIFEGSVRVPVIDPTEPKTLFLVTQFFHPEGRLVFHSFDRGETWLSSVVPQPAGSEPGWLLNLALGAEALYVTTNEGRLFVSDDRGQTWAQAPGPPVAAYQLAVDPVQPGTVYALGNAHPEQGFLLKLSPDASRIEYLTLLGGSSEDRVHDLAIGDDGRIYATGITASADFPVTSQLTLNRPGFDYDAFLTIVSPGGDRIEFSSWIGGSGHEYTSRIALGIDRTVVLAGSTSSRDFPLVNPVAAEPARVHSHWVAAVKPEEDRFAFAGYLAPNDTYGPSVVLAADSEGSSYIGGTSSLSDENGFITESNFLMRLDAAGTVTNVDSATVQSLAAGSPGRIVTAHVGASGVLGRPWRVNEAPAIAVSVRDYNAADADAPGLQALVNAADQRGHPLTPGTVVSIYGSNLGPAGGVPAELVDGRYPSEVAGVRVFFGDRPAPLLYVSSNQINAVTPGDLGEHPLVSMRVERDGAVSNVLALTTDSLSPAVFSMESGLDSFALAVNADGTVNSPGNPAARGSIVSVFATGVGAFAPALADGEVAPLEPPFPTATAIAGVSFPFQPAQVTYAGAAPGTVAGVAQINFVVPLEMSPYNNYFYLQMNEETTSAAVFLSVGP